MKYILVLLLVLISSFVFAKSSFAEDPTPTPTPTPENNQAAQDLQNKINELQGKIKETQGQEKTLSSQIAVMDNQVRLTQLRIDSTKQQIITITQDIEIANKKIVSLEQALSNLTKILLNRIVATYEVGTVQPFYVFLASNNIEDFFTRLNYLKIAQAHDKKLIYATEQAKNDYATQKTIFEDKKKKVLALKTQLESYTTQLNIEKQGRQRLLTETQGSEANYQKLLAQAKAQLSAFAGFTESVGTQLIPHQELSDGWGKYYNQRDSQWGNLLVNNDSTDCRGGPCTLARIGCLVTSYTMVSSHFGSSITPADVAVNSGNFSVSSADFNRPGPSANGHGVNYVADPSIQQLRDILNSDSNAVIIAGLSINGGPSSTHYSDHWVVLRSVDGDSFRINDPEYQGAMNVSLNDHYASWTIIEARIYH